MQLLIAIIFSLLFFSKPSQSQIVAAVGNRKITLKEFKEKFDNVKQAPNAPSAELFLEDLIRFEIGVQEAEKRKIENDPAVKERMRQVLYQGYLEKELGDRVQAIKISEGEMKRYYKKNPEVRLSHIVIELKQGANESEKAIARKRAAEIYSEVKSSSRAFEELVRLYTDDPVTKNTNGDIGWQTRMTLVPQVYEAAIKMKVGEIRGLIETKWGFHILKLTGFNTYDQANKRQIRAGVFEDRRRDLFDELFAKLKKNYKIEVNKKLVR